MNGIDSSEIRFRPITDDDQPFLQRLYSSTREDELAVVPWTAEEKQAFLEMQFSAQHAHYHKHYPAARFDVILIANQPAGRLYLDEREDELRIVDIALLPQFRGQGVGGRLMRDILDQAKTKQKRVRIHVEQNNPAMRLYDRLGFKKTGETGVYYLMEWNAPVDTKSQLE